MPLDNMPHFGEGERVKCPTCGFPVKLVYRGKQLDHYEGLPLVELQQLPQAHYNFDTKTIRELRKERSGKKTVAMVGAAPSSCHLAPYDEQPNKYLEIWSLNEMHHFPWMKRWDRWFQLHPSRYFTRITAARGIVGHYEWLKERHGKPIYMQHVYPEIPDSIEYPLLDVVNEFMSKVKKGDKVIKYFTNSLAYMIPIAIMDGFQRIELYGFEMLHTEEYAPQKACAEQWIGIAIGRGLEIYIPPNCELMTAPLYGYVGQGPSNRIEA
jgi:hypothetical protein